MTEDLPPGVEWIDDYAGLGVDEALALAETQGRPVRVLHPGDAMTMDWRPDRLNLYLDDAGALADVRAG